MLVFTLPSYPYVFKVIKDIFNHQEITKQTVLEKYRLVKEHDRVGRMARYAGIFRCGVPARTGDRDCCTVAHAGAVGAGRV